VPTRATDIPECFQCDCSTILAIAVSAEDNDHPILHDPGDDHVKDVDEPKVEIGHLHTDIGALHGIQETDHPITVTSFAVIGIIEVFQEPIRDLVQLDSANQLPVGP